MEARNLCEAHRVVRRRRIKGAAEAENFNRWGELIQHTDLMLNVLSMLPVYKAAQFRLVCRRWNAAFSTPHFASLLYLNSPETSWFVINLKSAIGVDVLAAYSYSAKAWFKFSLSFLGRLGTCHVAVSSNAGLVAFFKMPKRIDPRKQPNLQVLVFDPRKASLISRIDMPPNRRIDERVELSWFERMIEVPVIVTVGPLALIPSRDPSNNFKLVAFSHGEQSSFWVYNSLGKCWRKVKGYGFKLMDIKPCSLVRGNCAYFLARSHDWLHILVYNADTDEITMEEGWIPTEFNTRVIFVVRPNLFCCRGKLAMCDVIQKDEEPSSKEEENNSSGYDDDDDDDGYYDDELEYEKAGKDSALVIWEREFEDSAGDWKEVARMPQEMWTEMYSNVDCKYFPWMRICGSVNLVFLQLERWKVIVCNLDTGCWDYLPSLPKKIGQKMYEDVFMLDLI